MGGERMFSCSICSLPHTLPRPGLSHALGYSLPPASFSLASLGHLAWFLLC